MQELRGSHCLKIPRFAAVSVSGLRLSNGLCTSWSLSFSLALSHVEFLSVGRRSARSRSFFGSFEVGNQLDCLSTPEKSLLAHPGRSSPFLTPACSPPLLLYYTLTHGHATTLFLVYSLLGPATWSFPLAAILCTFGRFTLPPSLVSQPHAILAHPTLSLSLLFSRTSSRPSARPVPASFSAR